jgi:regulator of sigma E protease
VLDGGHIVMAIIEMIRRKPIGLRVQEIVTNGFALLVIGFMLYVTFFDVLDLPGWRKRDPQVEMTFSPTPDPQPTP